MKWTPGGMNNFVNGKRLYFKVYGSMTHMQVKEYKWKNSLGLGAESWHVLYILTSIWVLGTPNAGQNGDLQNFLWYYQQKHIKFGAEVYKRRITTFRHVSGFWPPIRYMYNKQVIICVKGVNIKPHLCSVCTDCSAHQWSIGL